MIPAFTITINGQDLTDKFSGVERFTLTDKRGFEADTLAITIADPRGTLDLPEKGAVIRFAIGYKGEALEDKGSFIVDGIGYDSPPDSVHIYARSANIKESFNVPKSRSFKATTLGDIIQKIAASQKLQPEISADLAAIQISHLDQTNESDGHLMTRLGATYGAVAAVKDDRLVFTALSRGTTPAGTPIRPVIISKGDCSRISYDNKQRAS
jgi:Bacteriophage probable baseplate hub protein